MAAARGTSCPKFHTPPQSRRRFSCFSGVIICTNAAGGRAKDDRCVVRMCEARGREARASRRERVCAVELPRACPRAGRGPRTDLHAAVLKHHPADLDISGSLGRRYRRQDEIGTPLVATVDHTSLEDQTVTVRFRDSMKQRRVHIDELVGGGLPAEEAAEQ